MRNFQFMCLSMGLCLLIGSRVSAYQDSDRQFWNSSSLEGNVHRQWKLRFEEQFRFGDDVSELYYHSSGIGLAWKTSNWLQTSLNYAHVYELKNGEWKEENRPFVDGILQGKWKIVQLSDRNRWEHRVRQGAESTWRYRNNLTLSLAQKWSPFDVQPYVSGEMLVDIEEEDFNQYRATGGLTGRLSDFLQANLYYLRLGNEKNGDWIVYHVLGTTIKVSL